jgi:7-carboxy-7-deazaguanine synthase
MTKTFDQIRITEIFLSLQGESTRTGLPTTFIRLTGCPLRCKYCDTAYAFSGGELMSIESILVKIKDINCPYICVTGGEPLAQPGCKTLLSKLCDLGFQISLETSGAFDIEEVDNRVMVVMDIKTPDSGESKKNLMSNLEKIRLEDQIKFVLSSQQDYEWASAFIKEHELNKKTQVLFSPAWNELDPTSLADWIVRDRLPVRFQIQLHKILWNDTPGH